ncbi:hypothetical protein B1748_25825 [Paenibacillus sp. MY03]|jgi:hypothetical protein|uniref:DUF2621 domain-containing protein n=1 Tax=Paenibacillus agaridevorans TaxID=171404 RepID=A0A2R5EP01_9BACL|nr:MULTISPECIES: DUF2621 domain-containing protein [Paenibacillus]OUS71928.1 hypothetical protein B1748_25825 [Paenibacillus sp. MY03]QNK59707.1 DUF2621 domain-containing protein [Paenibacillus sp. PAMC21692]GBG06728.1 hypothetical protein PAT3040_01262 [Paenibacillus agaridevorans]
MNGTPSWFMYFIVFWAIVMVIAMSVGGFFMFRKFLKVLPMRDGKSKLDWQNYWVERSRSMWGEESKQFLDELVSPVPNAFRDIAKHSIAAKIGQVAIEHGAKTVTREHCIEGYIRATPKRDYRILMSFMERKGIDYRPYEHLINK